MNSSHSRHALALAAALLVLPVPVPWAPSAAAQERARPDVRAVDAARKMRSGRASLGDVAVEMSRTYRQSAGQTAAILRVIEARPDEAGDAVMGAYRMRGSDASVALASGGYEPREVVQGMRGVGIGSGDVARGLRDWGLPVRDAVVAFQGSGRPAAETAEGLRAVEVPVKEAAVLLADAWPRLAPTELKQALVKGGFGVQPPVVTRYSIRDYRSPTGNRRIENLGIVDPDQVPSGQGRLRDGWVAIEGEGLDLPGTRVVVVHDLGETEGEIESMAGGEIEATFRDFRSGELRVETLGGTSSVPVLALSHAEVTPPQLFPEGPSFTFRGSDALMTWGFVPGATASPSFAPGDSRMGITVLGAQSEVGVVVEPFSGPGLRAEAAFGVGTYLGGFLTPMVGYWTCGSFSIEKKTCSPLTSTCIAAQIAELVGSALQCTNPDNWDEEVMEGPPTPVSGNALTSVTYRAYLEVMPDGRVKPSPGDPSFSGAVWTAIPDPGYQGAFNAVEVWWKEVVGGSTLTLNDAFGAAVAQRLEAWPQLFPGLNGPDVRLRGIHAQEDGSLLYDFQH